MDGYDSVDGMDGWMDLWIGGMYGWISGMDQLDGGMDR